MEDAIRHDSMSANHAELTGCKKLSGPQFDNAYIVAMVKYHRNDVEDFSGKHSRLTTRAAQ
jgi:predicted outer membrane protein